MTNVCAVALLMCSCAERCWEGCSNSLTEDQEDVDSDNH